MDVWGCDRLGLEKLTLAVETSGCDSSSEYRLISGTGGASSWILYDNALRLLALLESLPDCEA